MGKVLCIPLLGIRGMSYLKNLVVAIFLHLVSFTLSIAAPVGIGWLLLQTGTEQSWFTHNTLMAGLFASPACLVVLLFHSVMKNSFYSVSILNKLYRVFFLYIAVGRVYSDQLRSSVRLSVRPSVFLLRRDIS